MSDKIVDQVLYTADPTAAPIAGEAYYPKKADPNGALWIRPIATLGGGVGVQTSRNPTADGVDPTLVIAFDVASFNYIWDPVAGRWDREQRFTPADNLPDTEARIVNSFGYVYDGANWDRARGGADNADAVAVETQGILKSAARLTGYNGATWDRIRSAGNNADTVAAVAAGIVQANAHHMVWNGATWQRSIAGNPAANFTPGILANTLAVLGFGYGFNSTSGDWERNASSGNGVDSVVGKVSGLEHKLTYPLLWNGLTYDRQRNNLEIALLTSAARTSTTNSSDTTNFNARGLHVIINVTSVTDTPEVTPHIQGKDPISGTYYDILEGDPITATGITILKVYPGIGQLANAAASDILPRTFRVQMEHDDADSITYSVAAVLIV